MSWYALRFWIELGFKAIKSLGWQLGQDPADGPSAHLPSLAGAIGATLLALAYGTRVEDAHERAIAPSHLRTPPHTPSSQQRGNSGNRRIRRSA